MNLNRRQILGGMLGLSTKGFPINNISQEILGVLEASKIPIERVGIMKGGGKNTASFIKRALKIGISQNTIDDFLHERNTYIQRCEEIGKELLQGLGIDNSEQAILISSRTPSSDFNDPSRIHARWGYPEMSWEDFFAWEGRHTVKGSYRLEEGIDLPCSNDDVSATGSISIEFTPQGIIKLIMQISKKSPGMTSGSTKGIEVLVKNAEEIQTQIFKWKSHDWSQSILKEHTEAKERLQNAFENKNKEIRKRKILNILKLSTSLTDTKTTLKNHKKIASI